jgi:molybdopterin-containing oxidoreductase family membrane subunit
MLGPYAWAYWSLIFCNGLVIQTLWFKKVRTTPWMLFVISLIVSVGMWLERFVIIVTSLSFDFLPSSWAMYRPTMWDLGIYFGTIGVFFTLFLLFARALPAISIAEMRELIMHEGHSAGLAGSASEHEIEVDEAEEAAQKSAAERSQQTSAERRRK